MPATARPEILGRETAAALRAQGITDLRDMPPERLPQARHRRMVRAVRQAALVCEPVLGEVLQSLGWPRHFLRLDTVGFAAPVWPATRPYEGLPFRWTLLTRHTPASAEQADHFLADSQRDPREDFTHRLLEALDGDGPVFAYHAGFERSRLSELARALPARAAALARVQSRIVDVSGLVRRHAYHPAQQGAWSFRALVAAMVPDLAAPHPGLADGSSSQAAFAASLQRDCPPAESTRLRQRLAEEGLRQARALARLVAALEAAALDCAGGDAGRADASGQGKRSP